MRIASFYPVLCTADVRASARFYIAHFGFRPVFESDWYIHLTGNDPAPVNLALLRFDHDTIPAGFRRPAAGTLLNFEVEDVDAEYARLRDAGVPIVQDLRSEAFGQRHFIARDPDGVLIDVITPIPPAPEFASAYTAA